MTRKMDRCRNIPIPRVSLDADGCITLTQVLQSFTAGVNEEQAWALCYQIIKTGQLLINHDQPGGGGGEQTLCLVTQTNHVKLHQDGSVDKNTFLLQDPKGPPRIRSSDECKIISKLVHVVYEALEYGMEEDAERVLSPDLESFMEKMIYADESEDRPETDDEGIENDHGDSDDDSVRAGNNKDPRTFNFLALLKVCRDRLGSLPSSGSVNGDPADNHYKAVIRALVAETLELSTFLEKVAAGTYDLRAPAKGSSGNKNNSGEDPGLDGLHFSVWARLWVQVIHDLRNGVKLKKVESFETRPIEYELTPYEILMDDIRSRRYKLNKVMVDGELPPRIKRDAHELILEFIRGRPPLRKAADRVLPPAPNKPLPPIEALMESIRTQDPMSLRPTRTIVKNSLKKESFRNRVPRRPSSHEMTSGRTSSVSQKSDSINTSIDTTTPTPTTANTSMTMTMTTIDLNSTSLSQSTPQRRLIKADLDALYGNDKDDSDEDDRISLQVTRDADGSCYYGQICPEHTQSEPVTPFKTRDDELCDISPNNRRRHTVCNESLDDERATMMITFPLEYTTNTLNVYNLNGPAISPILARRKQNLPRSMSKSMLQEEFFQSNQWQTAIECLSLNLEEVVHIRNVLTKAELESLPVDCSTKDDVEKGKVCFLCLKSRFSLFGPWGNSCKLCKRIVCAKCCSKMRIPTEHFANIPVATLSPLLSPTREEDSPIHTPGKISPIHHPRKNSVGSAPNSPSLSRRSDDSSLSPATLESEEVRDRVSPDGHGSSSGPYSLPTMSSISLSLQALKNRSFGLRKEESKKTERLMGQLMVVCHDCKAMVLQIIRSSRAKKGQELRKNRLEQLDLPLASTN